MRWGADGPPRWGYGPGQRLLSRAVVRGKRLYYQGTDHCSDVSTCLARFMPIKPQLPLICGVQVWDMASMGCKRTLKGHANDVLSIALKKDYVYRYMRCTMASIRLSMFVAKPITMDTLDTLLSGDADGNIFVWRRDTHQQVLALKGSVLFAVRICAICLPPIQTGNPSSTQSKTGPFRRC